MPSDKPKILFVVDDDLLARIDDYRYANRIPSRAETIRRLVEASLSAAEKAPKKNQQTKK
jgi:metal-responsive CopG/Arc/MetJ family transcriptional regulator